MDRRSFLTAASALTLNTVLAGCNSQRQAALRVRLLKNSLPAQLPGQFRKSLQNQQVSLEFKPEDQLQTLFTLLQTWKRAAGELPKSPAIPFLGNNAAPIIPDLVTLGDYWLTTAIRQGLIQPLNLDEQAWQAMPDRWKTIVTRNDQGLLDPQGKVWAAPYRWGSTVIVYRTDIFREQDLLIPQDWGDLWREDLRGRISLLDQPREVIGLTLKQLSQSYNTVDLNTVSSLEDALQSLHRQVKFYSSEHYLQPLLLGDTWLAVGWSTDVLPLIQRNQPIAAVFPASGTSLWTDVWVRPATAPGTQALLSEWINFCWQPEVATQLSLLSYAASPILSTLNATQLPKPLQANSLLTPPLKALDHSEFLQPLPDTTVEQYRSLWEKLRRMS